MKREICAAIACLVMGGAVYAQEPSTAPGLESQEGAGGGGPTAYNLVHALVSGDGMSLSGSTVQLYGLLAPTIAYIQGTGARAGSGNVPGRTVFASNGSYWGIRGVEDLGGGWQAIFQYENTINLGTGTNTNGSGNFAGRDTFLGMQQKAFGVVEMGLITSPLYGSVATYKFLGDQLPIASVTTLMTTINGTSLQFNNRVPGAIFYSTSKNSTGLVGHFLYAPNQSNADPTAAGGRVYTLSGSYGDGPFYIQYIYESRANQDKLAKGSSNDWAHRIVGRYSFTPTFAVAYGFDYSGSDGTYGKNATAGPGRVSRQAMTVSLAKNIGRTVVIGSYGYARAIRCTGAAAGSSTQCMSANQSSTAAQQASLVFEYQFSKRTMVSMYVSRIWNRSQGLYDFDSSPVVQSVSARTPGMKPTGAGVGFMTVF
jgi:general bacterial porin, GBP family